MRTRGVLPYGKFAAAQAAEKLGMDSQNIGGTFAAAQAAEKFRRWIMSCLNAFAAAQAAEKLDWSRNRDRGLVRCRTGS